MKRLLFLAALLISAPLIAQDAPAAKKVDATAAIMKNDPKGRFLPLHESFLARAKQGPIGVLFLGDSITERWNSAPHIWEHYFGKYQPANFGIGGDQTQHVIWRLANGELEGINPKVVVLMIGTNNTGAHTGEEIAAGNKKIIEMIQAKLPETKILLLAIFPRGPLRNARTGEITEKALAQDERRGPVIKAANEGIAKLADGEKVRFLDIGKVFLGQDGKVPFSIMPDQVHLSPAGYQLWAEAIDSALAEMMQ